MKPLNLFVREEGSSLAAVIALMMMVSVIAVAAVQVAMHTNDVTSVDRERLQAVSAAEAGVNDAIRRLAGGAGCDAAVTPLAQLTDNDGLVSSFQTKINPEAGNPACTSDIRVIDAWGTAATGGERALRKLEVTVKLVPLAGFPYAVFVEGTNGIFYVKNSGTVGGNVYAENLDQSKNNIVADSIVTPGSIETVNNASYSGTLWAGGNVHIANNGNIGGSILASGTYPGAQGNIILDTNSRVGSDVRAKGTVTKGGGVVIGGALAQNDPNLPAPPNLVKPVFVYDPANYPGGVQQGNAATISAALSTNKNNLKGAYYCPSPCGTVSMPNSATVTGDLTIISGGKLALAKTLSVSGGPYTVSLIALSTAADAVSMGTSSFTAASGLNVLIYTLGGVDVKNALSMTGSIYADSIDAKNTFTVNRSNTLATSPPPGFTFTLSTSAQYSVVPTLWREVAPTPPS